MAKIKIAIDAAHGSKTAGKRTPPLTKNIDINHDGKIDLKKGIQYKENAGCDYSVSFISTHMGMGAASIRRTVYPFIFTANFPVIPAVLRNLYYKS
ncbi:MAG: hypothetical protein K0R34_4114 [Herbinix sp.]|jgi:hypothetical protein|nr:hypothetical protein [Herbinix sp.]